MSGYYQSAKHVAFVVMGALGTYFFYEHGFATLDRVAISAHVLYIFASKVEKERWIHFVVTTAVAYQMHEMSNESFSRNVNNVLVPLLGLFHLSKKLSIDLVIGLVVMGLYLCAGGPKKLTYSHRICWHAACNCVISELIKL